jgi:adenylate cyclase
MEKRLPFSSAAGSGKVRCGANATRWGAGLADVFVSYARSDEAVARRIANALGRAGLDVWWDADLPAHRTYSDVIERNLAEAKAVLVLWSKSAAASQWVRAEADFARNAGKLVQAQLDGTLPPMPFNQIQCADLKGWRGSAGHRGWTKLQGSVQALVSGEEPAKPVPARRRLWDRLPGGRWAFAGLFALIVAAGLLYYIFGASADQRKPVLAVMPFRSLAAGDESLVAGIWEDTRTAIGQNPQLIVLGPNTVEELAKKDEAATKRAADYLLQASVRTVGDRIRVSTDLVRTKDGQQLWSQDFDRKLDDVFALQSEIADEIEGRIRGRLAEKGGTVPEHIATSGDVYALYSDARAKIRKRDYGPEAKDGRDELLRVVKLDPNFAPGWATLAIADRMALPSQKDWRTTDNSEAYARKALDLAPNLAAAHSALAFALNLKGPVALAELQRAVDLDPSDYEAWNWFSSALLEQGRDTERMAALRRSVEIEPFFWPAVLNLYDALRKSGDTAGVQALIDSENRVGATFLAASIQVDREYRKGNLANAANLGLKSLGGKDESSFPGIAGMLWVVLQQLDLPDAAAKVGSGPDFGPYLWRNDPKGLAMMESHHMDAKTFFRLQPLTENAGRVYLLSGRGKTLADLYLSLKMSPQQLSSLSAADAPDHFVLSAPLIVVALQQNGHPREASALLSAAESEAKDQLKDGTPASSVNLARVYAVQGRKDEAVSLLASAIERRWLPEPPVLQVDLNNDPALAGLKADPRFQRLRQQILGTVARERAKLDRRLLARLESR